MQCLHQYPQSVSPYSGPCLPFHLVQGWHSRVQLVGQTVSLQWYQILNLPILVTLFSEHTVKHQWPKVYKRQGRSARPFSQHATATCLIEKACHKQAMWHRCGIWYGEILEFNILKPISEMPQPLPYIRKHYVYIEKRNFDCKAFTTDKLTS